MSLIGALETAFVQRLRTALTLPGATQPQVDVRAWAGQAKDYALQGAQAAMLVIYRGSQFHTDQSIHREASDFALPYLPEKVSRYQVNFNVRFEIALITRIPGDVGESSTNPPAGSGAYQVLEVCKRSLYGWRPTWNNGASRSVLSMIRETFDDYADGLWFYSLHCAVPMFGPAPSQDPPDPWLHEEIDAFVTQIDFQPQ